MTSPRDVRFQGLSVELAGDPYECLGALDDPEGGFSSLVPCSALVHARGPGEDDDWLASNGVGLAEPRLVRRGDLVRTTKRVLHAFLQSYYQQGHAKPSAVRAGPVDVTGAAGRAFRSVIRVPVHEKDLPTTSDTVEIVLVQLASGRDVAWWSVQPDDAGAADGAAAAASLRTLTVAG